MCDFINLYIIILHIKSVSKRNYFYNFKGLQINNNIVFFNLLQN